ncbi:uncharacterized protein LOC108091352 [Drosophila ficusphila]|uniref:uncharacterized protein LOC108091352 n=1 Tax=Drosophila ficusphila TaxID=30025 RepID=UPI0007E6980D|nr:uncharacterized protein LOC108091352 [Drosophila ficusphila]
MVIEKEHPLDNCQLFVQLRMLFQDKSGQSVKCLKNLIYWSGNEEHIAETCNWVNALLLEHDLVIQKPHAKRPEELVTLPSVPEALNHLRGLLVYLILNTATEQHSDQSQWSARCIHLCRQLPAIPQFLTIAIALRCGMQQPLEEFLACGPRWLTYQYFESLSETISHITKDRLDTLPMLFSGLKAAGRSIVYHNIPESNKRLLRLMASMLQRHLVDSEARRKELPVPARRVYLAQAMQQLLELLTEILSDPNGREKPKCFAIYSQMSVDISGSYSTDYMSDLRLFAFILLDALQRIMQLVSLDTYMQWLELPSERVLYSYQELICSKAAEMLKLVQSDEELSQNAVCKQLQNFAEAAKSFEQRLAELTIGDLLSFLDGDLGETTKDQRIAGLAEVFGRVITFASDECVETIEKHLDLLTAHHAELLLSHLGQVVDSKRVDMDEGITIKEIKQEKEDDDGDGDQSMSISEEDDDDDGEYASILNKILRPLFQKCSTQEKIHLLELRDRLGVTNVYKFETPDHQERRVRFFNRLEFHRNFPLGEFLNLCYENPAQTWLDLARLGMTHQRFAELFWRVACHCALHAVHHLAGCSKELLVDEQLLLKPNALSFLLSMYGHRQILNGLRSKSRKYWVCLRAGTCPYDMEQLKEAQGTFLEACADGLEKFSEPLNYTILQFILRLLLQISVAEKQLQLNGNCQLAGLQKDKAKSKDSGGKAPVVQEAKHYLDMHAFLPEWRQGNWPLISKLMVTIDALRWDLNTFEQARVDALDMAVKYWSRNFPHLQMLGVELRQKVIRLASQLKRIDFWVARLDEDDSSYKRRVFSLLTQASGAEATNLFAQSLQKGIVFALFDLLSHAVVQAKCESALEAYKFLFRRYMVAFRNHFLHRKPRPVGRRTYSKHLMDVVARAPLSIRNDIMAEARLALCPLLLTL